jgi:CRP/FNR family transcriptional regulator, cyclic AMP receptor protein
VTATHRAEFVPGTFLARLREDERAAILELGVRRRVKRGAPLMHQDEHDERVMLLLEGRVKVSCIDEGGGEVILGIRDPGDLVGELGLIDSRPRAAGVYALDGVVALVIPAPAFRSHLASAPRVMGALLELMAGRLRETSLMGLRFARADTMGRLAARIVELAERYGKPGQAGITVALPFSQDELAAWTGASRAGVKQSLHAMRDLGWIETEHMRLLVRDLEALRARSAE